MSSKSAYPSTRHQGRKLLLGTILFLFTFQLITEFVEGIYLYGLLGTSIPPEIGMVLLFLAPFLLLAFRGKISTRWLNVLATIVVLSRAIEIALPTRGRMIISGIGVAATLMYFTGLLSKARSTEGQWHFADTSGAALGLGLFASVALRALHSGSDLSAYGMFRLITWGLALAGLILIWQTTTDDEERADSTRTSVTRLYAYTFGITSVIVVLYFALTAPNVVARWAGVPGLSVYAALLIAWVVVGWWWLRRGNAPSRVLFVWGLLFAVVMLFTLLPHQVQFPSSVDGGYPLLEPQIAAWQIIPLYLMLALSPVLMLIFVAYTEGVLAERPSLNALAGAFGLAGLYLLIMILAQVFTTVYDYIPVVGPFFRDKFWLVLLVPSLGAALPAILARQKQEDHTFFSPRFQRSWVGAAVGLSVVALVGAYALAAKPTPPPRAKDTLRVFTYNIQQGYDAFGERNFDGQVQLLRSRAPDIIGLQECDTARIAGGNADIVAYFADWLRMYSYYGPSPVVGTFGDALLSRYPNKAARTYYLYSEGEQVAVVQADVLLGDQTYRVYVNHFGNGGPMVQAQQLLDLVRGQTNAIIIGDFNFRPYEEQYALITAEFDDAYEIAVQKNIPADFDPQERIDHVFVSPGIEVLYVEYLTEPESDHPGLFVEVAR